MKKEKLFEVFTDIDDKYIEAAHTGSSHGKKIVWAKWVAIAACLSLLIVGLYNIVNFKSSNISVEGNNAYVSPPNYALATAILPVVPIKVSSEDPTYWLPNGLYDDEKFEKDQKEWSEYYNKQREDAQFIASRTNSFYEKIIPATFSENVGKNTICSPVNLYMAVAMLAECAGGESREEIVKLLGAQNIEEVRELASRIWNSNFVDNGELLTCLANSVWLKDGIEVDDNTLKTLAGEYYADIYSGNPSDSEYEKTLQNWLNDKTGGQLEDTVNHVHMDSNMVLELVSTIDFGGKWQYPFEVNETKPGIFHGVESEKTVDFMNKNTMDSYYYYDKFAAVQLAFSGGDTMWLVLPDEGYSTEEIAGEEDFIDLIEYTSSKNYAERNKHRSYVEINLSIPKFDISSDIDEASVLSKLGVESVFSPQADFSSLLGSETASLTKIEHAARVTVDEEGCKATAFTLEELCGAAMPEDTVDFVLDRPFIFAITGYTGEILFVGTVNQL